jgi:hypothetical protein
MNMQIVGKPAHKPGVCVSCNTQAAATFVDTGRNIRGYGYVYICSNCVRESFVSLGLASDSLTLDDIKGLVFTVKTGINEELTEILKDTNERVITAVRDFSGSDSAINGLVISKRIKEPAEDISVAATDEGDGNSSNVEDGGAPISEGLFSLPGDSGDGEQSLFSGDSRED